ncbi:hypothetical protein QR680_006702 [Steinernema hermaphroditum]|uniref:Uncharacterized protein n=1 Tax=Steinernema hermaphroditum TaxID=289476 RepID=A0AA39HYR8_9BILA|nr:hypothetical protein QR680_006702 [Steinernema hermaphroditum]
MDSIPLHFVESLFRTLFYHTILNARDLPGYFGSFAGAYAENRCNRLLYIEDNAVTEEQHFMYSTRAYGNFAPVAAKYVAVVEIHLLDDNDEEIEEKLSDRIRHPCEEYDLIIKSSSVSKHWIEWACSWKRLTNLSICEKPGKTLSELCEKLIERNRLATFQIYYHDCDVYEMDIITRLLCQEQFKTLFLLGTGGFPVLLDFWTDNAKSLAGKRISFQDASPQEVSSLFEGKLALCSDEECDSLRKNHHFFYRTLFRKPPKPFKFLVSPNMEDHAVYVFFDCSRLTDDQKEAEFLEEIDDFVVFFG